MDHSYLISKIYKVDELFFYVSLGGGNVYSVTSIPYARAAASSNIA